MFHIEHRLAIEDFAKLRDASYGGKLALVAMQSSVTLAGSLIGCKGLVRPDVLTGEVG